MSAVSDGVPDELKDAWVKLLERVDARKLRRHLPALGYYFFTDGNATPASVAQCPAPVSSCTYPPPKRL
jgi:hypothetical protein